MNLQEKRRNARMPLQIFLNEYVDDQPQRCMSINLSPNGLFLNRLALPQNTASAAPRYPSPNKLIGLEFELPETSEVIWAAGQIRFDAQDRYFHGTGVLFAKMADLHRRLVRDYVLDHRERRLRTLLARVRRRRRVQVFVPRMSWAA
ncbi:MAG: PilZ domain-containing protein [Deltaproteobacteria bacterium]|nr:PilZ domain-containing protein [Deltaproteobacteria bacterium]